MNLGRTAQELETGDQISWLLSFSPQVPYHKMNAKCKTWIVTGRTAPISAFRRTPWHNGTRLRRSVFLSRMFWFMSLRIIDGLQPFRCISTDPCRKASISCSQILSDPKMRLKGPVSFESPCENVLTQLNICKALFTRMIGVPVLMWKKAITCNNDKYLRSFLVCLRSGMAKKFKWCSITL